MDRPVWVREDITEVDWLKQKLNEELKYSGKLLAENAELQTLHSSLVEGLKKLVDKLENSGHVYDEGEGDECPYCTFHDELSALLICPDCGAPMKLRRTHKFRWTNGEGRLFYGCSRWPECSSIHGAHPDGSPLGIPGDKATKQARIEAHVAFDAVLVKRGWGGKGKQRAGAYIWLGRKLGIPESEIRDKCHMAMFDIETCQRVIVICNEALKREKVAQTVTSGKEK